MRNLPLAITSTFLMAGVALAHSGVKDATVMARMNLMSDVGAQTKIIGQMAKGETSFDVDKARAAAAAIAAHAAETPTRFEDPADDPKSEAKRVIWENYADFTAKSDALVRVAQDLSISISRAEDLQPAIQALGAACKDCHATYRE